MPQLLDAKRVRRILSKLRKMFPEPECALMHNSAFELLVATILSAQCTDKRVNMVTPALFEKYPTADALAEAKQKDVEKLIQSLGFFRAKASNLREMAKQLVERHDAEVPQELPELTALAGVGRKTANVVLGTWFRIPSGVVVDTHVKRITRLLGLTRGKTPEAIEKELMEILPKKEWIDFSHRIIHHGRATCIARNPRCHQCPLLSNCDRVGLQPLSDDATM